MGNFCFFFLILRGVWTEWEEDCGCGLKAFGEKCVHVCQHSHLHSTRQPPAAPVWTTGISFKSFRASFTVLHENHWAGATGDRGRSQPWLKPSRLQSISVYTGIHSKRHTLLVFTHLPNSNLPCYVWPGILQITVNEKKKKKPFTTLDYIWWCIGGTN